MKKKNAFTLMELLAVIALLSIILLIATPTIIGIVEDAKKDTFSKSVLSVINVTKMDIVSKVYEDAYIYTLDGGVITNLDIPVSNVEKMNGYILHEDDGGIEYAVHNETYCVKKTSNMKEEIVEEYTGKCDFITSEKCFAFSKGSIANYYDNEENNSSNPKCPRDIRIPETINGVTVTKIVNNAFKEKNITSVRFPNTLIEIGQYAFSNNKINDEIDLSNTKITSIGSFAFLSDGSTNQITSVKFPSTLTSIGQSAFSRNKISGELDLSNTKVTTILPSAFFGTEDRSTNQITSVKFPDTLELIYHSVFKYNAINGELDLSNTKVTSIGNNAFATVMDGNPNKITSVKLPSTLTSIGQSVFENSAINGELDLSNTNLTSIGWSSFRNNQITSIKFPSTLEVIDSSAFADNKLSGELDLSGTSLISVNSSAFTGSRDGSTNKITSVKFPSTLEIIEGSAFSHNKLSGEIDLSNTKVTSLGSYSFEGLSDKSTNQITSVKFPSTVTEIKFFSFQGNNLESVTFYGRSDLTGVTLGSYALGSFDTSDITFIQ